MTVPFTICVTAAVMAGLLALTPLLRGPRSVAQWAFAAGMAAFGIESLLMGFAGQSVLLSESLLWQSRRLLAMSFLPGCWLLFSLTYSRGNYLEFLSKSRWQVLIAFAVPLLLAGLYHDQLIRPIQAATFDAPNQLRLTWAGKGIHVLLLLASILVLMNLERTFRASVGTLRWRIKYVVLGLGLLFVVRAYSSSQSFLFSSSSLSRYVLNAGALGLACVLIAFSFARSKLVQVDVYPSTAFLQYSLTLFLAGTYLLVVGVLANVAALLGGDAAFPLKSFVVLLALLALTTLLLSEKARQWYRQFISRHLRRPHYDYRQIWTSFTSRTAAVSTPAELCRKTVGWIAETLNVLSVTVWLVEKNRNRLTFGASTAISDTEANQLQPPALDLAKLPPPICRESTLVDLDGSESAWADALRRCQPEFFRDGGNRFCVSLVAGGELTGFLSLGDRVNGVPFSPEDLDLLKCLGNQVAGSLLNVQLSQRLLQAREMEAFQTMSAFFVHDLKNLASSLSLMLKNASAHFDNPAFRADALGTISRSVDRINGLIQRLTALRQGLELKPAPIDLNKLVAGTLAGLEITPHASVLKNLRPMEPIWADADHIQTVVTNLFLNALDAVGENGEKGEVRMETGQHDGWAEISVADNGCGMSSDFVANCLFQPFQTTKKMGIGIGLFHCKVIIEAHGGKIEVESREGQGTSFRVLLPASRP